MSPRTLAWIAQAVGGRLAGADRTVDAIATDTRALPGGQALFVALKGENYDGHAHVQAGVQADARKDGRRGERMLVRSRSGHVRTPLAVSRNSPNAGWGFMLQRGKTRPVSRCFPRVTAKKQKAPPLNGGA